MLKVSITFSFISTLIMSGCVLSADDENALPIDHLSWDQNIDRIALKEMRRTGIPSLQIAIGHKGEVVFERAYGYADIDNQTPATIETQYRTASISKWFTGTATMKLVESGKLDLDKPIQSYCAEFPKKEWDITTRQLMSHTAGVRHYNEEEAETASTVHYDDVIGPLESFKNDPLVFEPGMGWSYSSHGFRVLGCVIKGASGTNYSQYLNETIFIPTKMDSTIADDSTAPPSTRASGYELRNRKRLKPSPVRDVSENLPAGGHLSTASDLIRFSQSFNEGTLLTSESISLMSSLPKAKTGKVLEVGYGHGVDIMGAFEGSIGHGGRQEGTTTLVVLLPEEDLSVALMTNASGWGDSNDFARKVLGNFKNGQRP